MKNYTKQLIIACVLLINLVSFFGNPALAAGEPDFFSTNLYVRLGLSHQSTSDDIRKAYRKWAMVYHPDRNPGDQRAAETTVKINEAHDILSDDTKRTQYNHLLKVDQASWKTNQANTVNTPPRPDIDYRAEAKKIEELKNQYPTLAELIDYILDADIYSHIPEKRNSPEQRARFEKLTKEDPGLAGFVATMIRRPVNPQSGKKTTFTDTLNEPVIYSMYILPDVQHFAWPSNKKIVEEALKTKNPYILKKIVFDIMTLPGWESHEDLLNIIIDLNLPMVSGLMAEFMYSPEWVNKQGADILSKLIDLGFGLEVSRALGIAGGIGTKGPDGKIVFSKHWYDISQGAELMKKLIALADEQTLKKLDAVNFSNDNEPWSKVMRSLPEFKDLPYISGTSLKIRLQEIQAREQQKTIGLCAKFIEGAAQTPKLK